MVMIPSIVMIVFPHEQKKFGKIEILRFRIPEQNRIDNARLIELRALVLLLRE